MITEKSKGVSFNIIGGKDVMPIGGFYGPYTLGPDMPKCEKDPSVIPDFVSEECFKLIAECGVNLITASADQYDKLPMRVMKSLDLGEQYGVGIMVNDDNVLKRVGDDSLTIEEVKEVINDYVHHPAFCGIHLLDEPTTPYYVEETGVVGEKDVSRYRHISKILQGDLQLLCYINMYPTAYGEKKVSNYKRYVQEFCETLKPKILMWDYYPFDKLRDENWAMYFWNMDLIRQYSEKYQVPFWAFIQAGSQWAEGGLVDFDSERPYYPNEGQFHWNVNTCLAFGAQGIQYFPLVQPYYFAYAKSEDWDFERNGIIGAAGNRTQWFHYAKDINKHIAAIDEVLMNSVHKGIIASGEEAKRNIALTTCVIESDSFQELESVTGDALIGCFNYNGRTALYVVNHDMIAEQDITLNFDGNYDIKVIQKAVETADKTGTITLSMSAGEGVLVIV